MIVIRILGLLLGLNGLFMLTCAPVSYYYNEADWLNILIAGGITSIVGFIANFLTRKQAGGTITKKSGYLIVTLGWLLISLFGSLPYLLMEPVMTSTGSLYEFTFTNAFYETISGFTTTGATILSEIEPLPKGILLWRSMTHWIGGMGIIVLAVAILPLLGIGGMQLFGAEAPGVKSEKLRPKIQDTALRLWGVYVALTILECLLLWAAGMDLFDAVNHAMATMATGGFSTKNASMGHYTSPLIHYIVIGFMFLAGTNFTLIYFGFKGRFKKVLRSEEFRTYLVFIVLVSLVIAGVIIFTKGIPIEQAIRESFFQTISLVTTTGFITADYIQWGPFVVMICFLLLFAGGSAGSTAGGIKIMRHIILIKNSIFEFRRQLHPNAIIPARYNKRAVSEAISHNISAFILIYGIIFFIGMLIMSAIGVDFETTIGAVASCLGNVGPGIGSVGPVDNYGHLPTAAKWLLCFLMLLGRLELFTVLMLFSRRFWLNT